MEGDPEIRRGSSLHPQNVTWEIPKEQTTYMIMGGRVLESKGCDSKCMLEASCERSGGMIEGDKEFANNKMVRKKGEQLWRYSENPCYIILQQRMRTASKMIMNVPNSDTMIRRRQVKLSESQSRRSDCHRIPEKEPKRAMRNGWKTPGGVWAKAERWWAGRCNTNINYIGSKEKSSESQSKKISSGAKKIFKRIHGPIGGVLVTLNPIQQPRNKQHHS